MSEGTPRFEIRNEPSLWTVDDFIEWRDSIPEKLELLAGYISGDLEDVVPMLEGLLAHVGADRVVQLGDPEVWKRAVDKLDERGPG